MTDRLPNTACPNWADLLRKRKVPFNRARLPMKTEQAKRFRAVYDKLKVADIAGLPKTSELPNAGWMGDIGQAIYGDDVIREALICCPKKQSKTSFGALMLTAAFLVDKTPRSTYTILAPSVGIADMAFDGALGAIEADPTLRDLIHSRAYTRELESRKTGGTLAVKAYDRSAVTGLRGSVLIDEAWLLGEKSTASKTRAQIRGVLASSPSAKIISITTTSDDVPRGEWANQIRYARQVRDGNIIDPSFLPVIWEPWDGCDPWTDESVWPCLMPSYPHIVKADFYHSVIREAEEAGPYAIARDKAQFFNLSPKTASAGAEGWTVAQMLDRLVEPGLSLEALIGRSRTIWAGVDLGGLDDLSVLSLLGIDAETGEWLAACVAWATELVWTRNTSSRTAFDDFVADGDLIECQPGEDLAGIVDVLDGLQRTGKLAAVGIDPAGAGQLADALDALEGFEVVSDPDDLSGYSAIPVLGAGQSAYRMAQAVRTLEREADEGRLRLSDARLFGWSFSNVRITRAGAADAIDRSRRADKIDPVVALLDAVQAQIAVPAPREFDVDALIA